MSLPWKISGVHPAADEKYITSPGSLSYPIPELSCAAPGLETTSFCSGVFCLCGSTKGVPKEVKDLDLPAADSFRVQLWDVLPGKAEIESLGLGWG